MAAHSAVKMFQSGPMCHLYGGCMSVGLSFGTAVMLQMTEMRSKLDTVSH